MNSLATDHGPRTTDAPSHHSASFAGRCNAFGCRLTAGDVFKVQPDEPSVIAVRPFLLRLLQFGLDVSGKLAPVAA